ncbi:MAG: hypothetical protein WC284_05280 [Candidimonas sp.]|jgi:tellurite resistance protein TehA-like permease
MESPDKDPETPAGQAGRQKPTPLTKALFPWREALREASPAYFGLVMATGTWRIPMLLCLGLWRYGFQRFPFRYEPSYWGAIFPLGMYAACTWHLNRAMDFAFLDFLPPAFLYAALLGWLLTFTAMIRHVLRPANAIRPDR